MIKTTLPRGRAICYSGYREGQQPGQAYPSLAQIREDLLILQPHRPLLRLYDCTPHAERVLEVIRRDGLDFKVMLGAYLGAEMNNFGCPWGATYSEAQLEANIAENEAELDRLIALANAHEDIVFSVAVGNEATVDWTDHFVPVHRMVEHVRRVKRSVKQPVTFAKTMCPGSTSCASWWMSLISSRCTPTRCGSTSMCTRRWPTPATTTTAWPGCIPTSR